MYKNLLKIADLQAHNASHHNAFVRLQISYFQMAEKCQNLQFVTNKYTFQIAVVELKYNIHILDCTLRKDEC